MNNDKNRNFKEGRCNPNGKLCQYAKVVDAGGWKFLGCTHDPHKGKWVVEVEKCPKNEVE